MSHADVAAILEGAVATPGRLRALLAADTEEGAALRAHLADCDVCRPEAAAWQAVDEALVAVTPDTMTAPPAAKARILSNVLATGVARSPDRILGATGSGVAVAATAVPGVAAATGDATTGVAATTGEPPAAGRVWRAPGGAPLPSPAPVPAISSDGSAPDAATAPPVATRRGLRLLPGGREGDGIGFRVFLAVAAAAVFLIALGAALGGPLGLTTPTPVPDTTARVELEKVIGRMADLLQQPGYQVAALTDQSGEPAGAVVIAPADTRLLGVVTRALPQLPDGGRYVCILVRGEERYEVGYMKFAANPEIEGDVAYWVAPLSDEVPLDVGAPGDMFNVYLEGDTGGPPLLTTTF